MQLLVRFLEQEKVAGLHFAFRGFGGGVSYSGLLWFHIMILTASNGFAINILYHDVRVLFWNGKRFAWFGFFFFRPAGRSLYKEP